MALLDLPFEVVPSRYEEPSLDSHPHPARHARDLAQAKAEEVAGRVHGRVVIGADTLVVLGRRLLGKPRDGAEAARFLHELAGRTHQVITGVAVIDGRSGGRLHLFSRTTDVTFRPAPAGTIERYAATDEPLDKAGAYAIQGRGGLFVDGLKGDFFNVVGLPIAPLHELLVSIGCMPPSEDSLS